MPSLGVEPSPSLSAKKFPIAINEKHNYDEQTSCVCLVCGNRTHKLVNLHHNEEMTKMLMAYVGLPSQLIEAEIVYVCVQCIYKIQLCQEMRLKTKEKFRRTFNTIPSRTDTLTENISAKKPFNSYTKLIHRKANSSPSSISSWCNSKQKNGTLESVIIKVNTDAQAVKTSSPRNCMPSSTESNANRQFAGPLTTEQLGQPLFRVSNGDATLPDSATKSPHIPRLSVSHSSSSYAPTHPILDIFYERKESAIVTESGGKVNKYDRLENPHTARSTPQQFVCKNCQRLYQRKHFYSKHMRHCRPRSKSLDLKNSAKNGCLNGVESTRRYHCNVCPVTVESQSKLRKHKQIHLSRWYCQTCGNEFNALKEYEFHCVQCSAMQMIAEAPSSVPHRPVTRSQSRVASTANYTTSRISTAPSKRTNIDATDYDDDDDATSVTDTMYTKRMRYTDIWLEDHSKIANNDLFLLSSDEDYLQISSNKEYDLYLLDRLKMDIMLESFSCYVPFCDFQGDSHFKLMMHDFCDHNQKLLYTCKKCGNKFTRKVHLDFHLYCQNGGRYICFRCGDVFEFQDQLDRHLIRHTKSVNYRCNYCKFEFLTKAELLEHCDLESHDPNGERKLISIVSSMTIVNPTRSSKRTDLPRQYREHIMIMSLLKVPHSTSAHKHFRRRPQVGDVQFKGQMYPNCSSCILYV